MKSASPTPRRTIDTNGNIQAIVTIIRIQSNTPDARRNPFMNYFSDLLTVLSEGGSIPENNTGSATDLARNSRFLHTGPAGELLLEHGQMKLI